MPITIAWNDAGEFVCGKAEDLEELLGDLDNQGNVRTIILSVLVPEIRTAEYGVRIPVDPNFEGVEIEVVQDSHCGS